MNALPSNDLRRPDTPERRPKQGGCYLVSALTALLVVLVIKQVKPEIIPFDLFLFWVFAGTLPQVLLASWPLLGWGIFVSVTRAILTRNNPDLNRNAEGLLVAGGCLSIWAGVVEEICFRWIIFFGEMVFFTFINFLFFGWAGFGLVEWIYLHVVGPIADFLTLGWLHGVLFGPYSWTVGAALISSNWKFRSGHVYQGAFGWINSWFIGMFFFWLMFQYGLLAAMLVHFLYDIFIFIIAYFDAANERAQGYV